MALHNELGKFGEDEAVLFLEKNGYTIRERNWRFYKAEVDIIAQKNDVLAIIEVKTRSSLYFGNPEDFVNQKKIQLLVKAINNYVNHRGLDLEVRFDIIAVYKTNTACTINHLEDAFYHFE